MSFFADRKRQHEAEAGKAIREKDYAGAFFHTAKAAEMGLALAEQSQGKVAQRYVDDAFDLVDIANGLKAKARAQDEQRAQETLQEASTEEQAPSTWELQEKPEMKLEDVAGLDDVKRVLLEDVILPFKRPEVYDRFKHRPGAGVLMYGPPGNGKTFVARAIAGELDAAFFPVDCARIRDKYVGETEKNLKRLFDEAARHERAVLFFDEVEALLQRRGNRKINTVTQFLALTDGVVRRENCMLLLAATNKPWQLEEAALRPGRLGTHIYVGLPDAKAREAIVAYNMRDIPCSEAVSFAALAERMDGYSGADVAEVCRRAKKAAIRRQLQTDHDEVVTEADFEAAIGGVTRSVTPDQMAAFEQWRESRRQPAGERDE